MRRVRMITEQRHRAVPLLFRRPGVKLLFVCLCFPSRCFAAMLVWLLTLILGIVCSCRLSRGLFPRCEDETMQIIPIKADMML